MKAQFALGTTLAVLMSMSNAYGAVTFYGTLSNFDVINDTGETAHGFEIELDDCLPSQIYSTFGAPYNRYGTPTITTDGVNSYVRWASSFDSMSGTWAVGTETGSYPPTGGHSLFNPSYGGDPAYPNVPGDHFGISLGVNPSNTVYHWLVDGGGGSLVQSDTRVMVPVPVFNVVAPANPANPAAVQAVIRAPEAERVDQFGDAIWVKVFTTEMELDDPADLNDLVVGNAIVAPDTETEIEWRLLQTDPENPEAGESMDEADVADGKESVTRRYEFYAYTGGYDPENHEALHDNYDPSYVGDYLGNQNVALNFAAVPEANSVLLSAVVFTILSATTVWRRRSTY